MAESFGNLEFDAAGRLPMGQLPTYWASRAPDRPAVTQDDRSLTRAAFELRINRRARAFAERGVGQDDMVTILLRNDLEFFETAFAIWRLGATPNVVSWRLPDPELAAILDLAKPRLIVGLESGRFDGYRSIPAGFEPDAALSADPLPARVPRYWKAMTSGGSTGRPKIIVDRTEGRWAPEGTISQMKPEETMLGTGPLYHNAPFTLTTLALFAGCHVVNMARFDAAEALRLLSRYRVQWVGMVPTMMTRILKLPQAERDAADLSSLRILSHVAAPCPAWVKQGWIDWIGPERVWEIYAGTERLGMTTINGSEWLTHRGSVGKVQPGSQIVILDETGRACGPGEIGEIYFVPEDGGHGISYHYIGAEPKTRDAGTSLGDLGYLDAEGYLYIADRRTDLILSGGANIYPAEVEAAIDSHPAVHSCAVVGLPDEDMGQRVHAVVHLNQGKEPRHEEDALQTHVEALIARYKAPRSYEFVALPLRGDDGKVRRNAIREEAMARRAPIDGSR